MLEHPKQSEIEVELKILLKTRFKREREKKFLPLQSLDKHFVVFVDFDF